MNTADMVRDVAKILGLKPKQIGIGWLKDKYAIAKQRMCIWVRDLWKTSVKNALLLIDWIVKVLEHGFYEKPLNLSTAISNHFALRLRYDQIISDEKKYEISNGIIKVAANGFPNYFWEQRFGATWNNHRVGQEIVEWKHRNLTESETKIKLQAYASWLFNQYLEFRTNIDHMYLIEWDIVISNQWPVLWDGKEFQKIKERKDSWFLIDAEYDWVLKDLKIKWDIRTQITGPFIGYNTILSPEDTKAWELETHWLDHFEIDEDSMWIYKKISLYGLRRPLWVIPDWLKHSWQWNDILIQFTLPKSAYASTLIDTIFDYKTPQRSWWWDSEKGKHLSKKDNNWKKVDREKEEEETFEKVKTKQKNNSKDPKKEEKKKKKRHKDSDKHTIHIKNPFQEPWVKKKKEPNKDVGKRRKPTLKEAIKPEWDTKKKKKVGDIKTVKKTVSKKSLVKKDTVKAKAITKKKVKNDSQAV